MASKVARCTKVSLFLIFFYFVWAAKWMRSHLAIGVHAFDCTNRIKWCHKLLSAKQVNNEDLDHQLGPQNMNCSPHAIWADRSRFSCRFSTAPRDDQWLCTNSKLSSRLICQSEPLQWKIRSVWRGICGSEAAYSAFTFCLCLVFSLVVHRNMHICRRPQYAGFLYV